MLYCCKAWASPWDSAPGWLPETPETAQPDLFSVDEELQSLSCPEHSPGQGGGSEGRGQGTRDPPWREPEIYQGPREAGQRLLRNGYKDIPNNNSPHSQK